MKDYKAEADKLRGELSEARRRIEALELRERQRQDEDRQVRDRFKELLLDVLGR